MADAYLWHLERKDIELSKLQNNTGQITGLPKNPRLIKDDKYKKLVQSIKDDPEMLALRELIVYPQNGHYIVIAGNMRLKALQELKHIIVPCKVLPADTSVEKLKAYTIKDNIGYGEHEWEALANEWDVDQLTEWGLDIPDFALNKAEAVEDNYEIPDEIETDIVTGDLFEIGQHRLLCGDSRNADDVARLMNNEVAELLFTSPPYSDMRTYNGGKDLSIDNLIEFIPTFMPYANYQVINLGIQRKNNEIVQYWNDYIEKAKDCGYKFLSWNVWSRLSNGTGSIGNASAMFPIVHEWVFVFGKDKKELNPTILNENAGKVSKKTNRQKDGTLKERVHVTRKYSELRSVIECKTAEVESKDLKHPAMFPVQFAFEYIQAMTDEKEIVAESFTCSGTTMVAAHQLNRKCYAMEIDPKYVQIIIDRMLKLDPSIEIIKNGKPYIQSSEKAA